MPRYLNQPTIAADGVTLDSKTEARRYEELKLLERAGEISNLQRQVPYALVVNGIHVCSYIADFRYMRGEALIVEDVKSPRTRKIPAYRIKVKLMQACHNIQIVEV